MINEFLQYTAAKNLLQKNDKVLLAVSGGIDSVVMCHIFHQAKQPFAIAHCNFKLRAAASDEDEVFVEELARKLGVPFYATAFNTQQFALNNKASIQVAARDLRYKWLEEIRMANDYKFIATAHHQNDNAETMLYNLTKGTGIAGLHGILAKNGKIIRPLLFTDKTAIETYATTHQINFREDASNAETKYTRNKIRHEVMPVLRTINPALERTFFENAQRFEEIEQIYLEGINAYRKKILEKSKNDILISIRKIQKIAALPTVLYELLSPYNYSAAQVKQIIGALEAEPGKVFYSATHQIIKDRKHLILSEKTDLDAGFTLIQAEDTLVEKKDLQLHFSQQQAQNFEIITSNDTACLDFDKLAFPLMLRRWKEGDYFYPFGMNHKKKKLKRYFADNKFSRIAKDRTWILCDNDKRIVWVVGHRTDERFRILDKTTKVCIIKCEQN